MTNQSSDITVRDDEFRLTEAQKAARLGMSASFLQKDRLKDTPQVPFRRYGRSVRYREAD